MEILILFWVLCAMFAAVGATQKGRSGVGWFFVGLLCGPLGLLVYGTGGQGEVRPGMARAAWRRNGARSEAEALAEGEDVRVAGFGTFAVKNRPARAGRNPLNGEAVSIPGSTVPSFKAAKALRDAVNGG